MQVYFRPHGSDILVHMMPYAALPRYNTLSVIRLQHPAVKWRFWPSTSSAHIFENQKSKCRTAFATDTRPLASAKLFVYIPASRPMQHQDHESQTPRWPSYTNNTFCKHLFLDCPCWSRRMKPSRKERFWWQHELAMKDKNALVFAREAVVIDALFSLQHIMHSHAAFFCSC